MGKKIIPQQEVNFCDICGNTGYLKKCLTCDNEYCLICQVSIPGCVHGVNCCKECVKRDDVLEIVERHAIFISEAIDNRDNELRKIKTPTEAGAREGK